MVACRNPACRSTRFEEVPLSRRGTLWSYTTAYYQPPAPYISDEPFQPYSIAAVELAAEKMTVLGQVPQGFPADSLRVGMEMELVIDRLYEDEKNEYVTWKWQPVGGRLERQRRCSMSRDVAILGVGMHPWGKWGRNFAEYGVHAAQAALDDAGIDWRDVQFISGGDTIRNGYPGFIAGSTFAQALGWSGAQVASSYGACATGAQALNIARAQILAGLCDVALVVGADAAPRASSRPWAATGPTTRTGCASA
jgi:uncharacterized OB-fold protein